MEPDASQQMKTRLDMGFPMKDQKSTSQDQTHSSIRRGEFFSLNSVSTLWGPSATAPFVCAGSRKVPFATTVLHGSGSFYRVSVHFLEVLRDRRRRSDGFGGWKREFTWQVQGIGRFVKIAASAIFCGVAKTLAGVCHSKDCVLRGRCRESAPWILCFELEGLDS